MSILTPPTYRQSYTCSPDSLDLSGEDTEEGFEFDVKPSRKYFDTVQQKRQYIEEYTKKKKTELCKNFNLTGYCKYGDDCSFAHGAEQLMPKAHLHSNYKTKPCKRFFKSGYCSYGIRCQYIHDELKDIQSKEFESYLVNVFKSLKLPQPILISQLNQSQRLDMQRFQIMSTQSEKKGLLKNDLQIRPTDRLSIFTKITQQNENNEENSKKPLARKLFI